MFDLTESEVKIYAYKAKHAATTNAERTLAIENLDRVKLHVQRMTALKKPYRNRVM